MKTMNEARNVYMEDNPKLEHLLRHLEVVKDTLKICSETTIHTTT